MQNASSAVKRAAGSASVFQHSFRRHTGHSNRGRLSDSGPVIRAVHDAVIGDAVRNREDVRGFMYGCHDRTPEAEAESIGRFYRIAVVIDRPDPDAFEQRRLPIDEIPSGARPQIARGQCDIGDRVIGPIGDQDLLEHMLGQDLLYFPLRMETRRACCGIRPSEIGCMTRTGMIKKRSM